MMRYFFTADYHLGHENIIKFCNRPFSSVEMMNKVIITNHNQRVKPEDTVFFIGDFCFKNSSGGKKGEGQLTRAEEYERRLNGKIIFVKGNHDRNNSNKTIIERLVVHYGGKRINLVHNPEHIDLRYEINFVGHKHQLWKFKRIQKGIGKTDLINVGVDVWNFRPVLLNEIMSEYSRWKKTSWRRRLNDGNG